MVTFTFSPPRYQFHSQSLPHHQATPIKKSAHVFLLPIFFNALLIKVFFNFSGFRLHRHTHQVVSIVVIAFQYGFVSMTFDEVIRNSRSIPN